MTTDKSLTERHRPRTLDQVIGQSRVVEKLREVASKYHAGDTNFGHFLFEGPPGTGKTTTAKAFARALFGDDWQLNTLDLNASDERGVDVIREKVKGFARTRAVGSDIQVCFLDEMDQLTHDAQAALRRIMEDYPHTKFVLACNNGTKVIDPLRSRCTVFRFVPIPEEDGVAAIARICDTEKIEYEKDAIVALFRGAGGDMRRALNAVAGVAGTVTLSKAIKRDWLAEARDIITKALKGQVEKAEAMTSEWLKSGASSDEVINAMWDVLSQSKLSEAAKDKALFPLGDIAYRIAVGAHAELQIKAYLRRLSATARDAKVTVSRKEQQEVKETDEAW